MAMETVVQHFNSGALSYEELTGGCTRELARYIVQLSPEVAPESTILDNACGPAIVSEEILRTIPRDAGQPAIYAVDAAPAMIELARSKPDLTVHESVRLETMHSENLSFSTDTFTHSYTNLGILFFTDGVQGAREIYRTLKPGGTAIVTTWADLGYLPIVRKAQAAIRPDEPPYAVSISESWFSGDHLERVLRDGGFTRIDILEKKVHMCAPSLTGVINILYKAFYSVCEDWSGEEQVRFKSQLLHFAQPTARTLHRREGASSGGEQVGIPMTAIVAIARK
ncbi:hypothetical protein ONS95_004493 [Cadophora gregata]|uniref:uncharacterized protein n=1 Tax=Cadophora gregata TaxID=51156 RepID=UPI0026DCFD1F|nr:uncharacterized protein ONS95_004493 [Cadophora gregata]KAK0105986.1 hypothetical protein ONS95_004493 [Cadophora gregata]